MTFCTLYETEVKEHFKLRLSLSLVYFSADNFQNLRKLIHRKTRKKRKSQKINANKAHEKVYFKYCLRGKSFSFFFAFCIFGWMVKVTLSHSMSHHFLSQLFFIFFTTRSEIKLKLHFRENFWRQIDVRKIFFSDFKKIIWISIYIFVCKFNDLPETGNFSHNKKKFIFYFWHSCCEKWESQVKMKICIHAFIIWVLIREELLFHAHSTYQVLNMLRMWWFLWVLTHHEYRQDNEMKSLWKSERNFADMIMS